MIERVGEAFGLGEKLTVIRNPLQVGVQHLSSSSIDWCRTRVQWKPSACQLRWRVRILNIVNSLVAPVCQLGLAGGTSPYEAPSDVVLLTVSMDLHLRARRWCGAEGTRHAAVSTTAAGVRTGHGAANQGWRLRMRGHRCRIRRPGGAAEYWAIRWRNRLRRRSRRGAPFSSRNWLARPTRRRCVAAASVAEPGATGARAKASLRRS